MHVTDEVVARAPREELEAIELDGKVMSVLKLRFANGELWEFEVPRVERKKAKELVFALGGAVV